jgi:hypothetical protein
MTDSTRSPRDATTPLLDESAARWLELMTSLAGGLGVAALLAFGLRVLLRML